MSEPSKRARELTPEQLSELVMRRKKKRDAESVATGGEGIPRRGATSAPLSFAQQRLWLLDQLEPESAAYNLAAPARLRGELDPAVLARCLTEIARRHESLRTTFDVHDGEPVQVIAPAAPFPLPLIDLTGLPAGARAAAAFELARRDNATPFDLARGPLARAALLRLAADEHHLLFNMHHVVTDGWSYGLLFGELSRLYDAFVAGRPSPLPELPIQYADFASWQREWLQGAELERQVAYWRQQLQGAAAALELPTDRQRPPLQTHRGEYATLSLPGDLVVALRELSRRETTTLFMILLSGLEVVLHRWAGQDDLVVGSPSAGRGRVETEGLIGFFLNTLVLRTDLGGNPSFAGLLARVRETVLSAYRYQELPFERLLEELQVERQLSRSPLFQVLFNMITLPEIRLDLSGLRVEPLGAPEPQSKFDFTIYVNDSGGAVDCNLLYNADLFDGVRMEALLAEFLHVLRQGVGAPETPIEALSLVPPEMASRLPDPRRALPAAVWPGAVHELLSLHAARRPEREMVADGRESWSYGELEARANQLAHRLRQAGVEREDVVAIYAQRNASLVWAVLGALKAGAAFLILDPAYPASRLVDYLEIGGPAVFLAVQDEREPVTLPSEVEAVLAALPLKLRLTLPSRSAAAAAGFLADLPATPPAVEVGADDLAVVGFTSGSTGKPKAVLGLHGPLSQYQPWWAERFELGEGDRFGMLSALSHDPLQRDILTPMWVGASLAVPDPERMGEPGWLTAWIDREAVSVLHLTPAMLELVVGGETSPRLPRLRRAFVVGDLLRRSEVARLQRIAPQILCVNLYGSTETQRSVAFSVVPRPGDGGTGREMGREALPLGAGIPGVELLLLNAAGGLAGIGEAGEVYLRSRRLARGYRGDAELTAQRFLANPFRPEDAGDRIYRTGDLGRYATDGEVEFAGRADHQVKIRGFRIEPGEIEAALRRHPAVHECVVVARGDGEKRLVGYLAPAPPGATGSEEGEPAVPARELRAFLADQLPEYMIPAAFVWLAALPMTKTGKVDRLALPEPALAAAEEVAQPRTPVEELIAGIWGELLSRPAGTIGVDANFFELGGHSLLATRVLSRMREALHVAVPLRALFESPTVAGLAAAAFRLRGEKRSEPPPLFPIGRGPGVELPLSFAQQRLWILDQLEPGSFAYNLSMALQLHGDLAAGALEGAIATIVARHEALRTVFAETAEGEPRQVILAAGERPLPRVDLSGLPGSERAAEAARLAGEEALRPFDLGAGPLLRTTLLVLAAREHVLLLSMHHIVTDGWSMGIFTRELTELYRAFATGAAPRLRPLPLQYADFALWQRQWLRGEVLAAQLIYWKQHLTGAPPVLELPADRLRPAVQSHRGGRRWLALPRELTARIEAEGRHLGVTPFMTLLAVFAVLLRRYSGEEDLVIGTPIANRGRRELEELIGFFANTLALRVDAAGDPAFADLARRVREAALGAYAHQDLPFERLVDEMQAERNLGHAPIFQVMFILQNAPPSQLELGSLSFGALEVEEGRAQFDLSLALMELGDGLAAKLEYGSDLFDAATADRLLGHFGTLLANAVASPQGRISALALLSEAERREVLVAWNDTRLDFPAELTVHELFAASVRRAPDAVAVSCGGRRLLYGELDEQSERLARRLVALGVGPEVRIGLCLERTPEMVVAILAVLKAGGAYVPLDPTHPRERLGWILEDAGVPVLLADRASLAALPEHRALVVDPSSQPAEETGAPLPRLQRSDPENLAYVIFTSGSTGRPKGVEVRHRGVVNYLSSMARRPGLDERDTILALTTLSFDIAVTELLLPLAVGARIELVDRETAADAERLGALMADAGVTVMQATPATWTLLLEGGWPGLSGLKALAGGEALPAILAERLLPRVGELWNVYGPTETTVWSALHPVAAATSLVPIGLPLANTTIHLVDPAGEVVPAGVPGELCIGGEGLARGYLGRPDLTAERFVPDPFGGPAGGGRLYRTGDLARRLATGELEFFGRIDNQVKVRGFRIELGEIESALARQRGIAQSAVVVREGGAGERRLVAFLVVEPAPGAAASSAPSAASAPSVAELRAGLQEVLPDYMVPALFVTLAALPLTPSGKVDRRALSRLPLGVAEGLEEGREHVAPRNEIESFLAGVWSQVLGRERVGVHDNFFELGGDSIQAIQMVTRARRAGVRFTPRNLFQHQTIAALATVVEVAAVASREELRPTLFQQRLLAGEGAALRRRNEAVLLSLPAGCEAWAVEGALAELARRHAALRLRCRPEAAGWRLETAEPEAAVTVAQIDLAESPDEATLHALAGEVRDRIDLAVCPWTAALFRLGAGEPDRLLFSVHRLAVDGPSWEPLLAELQALAGPGLAAASSPAGDRGYGARRSGLVTELAGEESQAVLDGVAFAGSSPEEILAATLVEAVGRWSGARQVALEVEVRRPTGEPLAEGAIGCFSAIVPVVVEVEKELGGPLRKVKDGLRRGVEAGPTAAEPEISLRWRGRLGAAPGSWRVERLPSRPTATGRRGFEIVAGFEEGRLLLEWSYTEAAHRPEAVRALADATAAALRSLGASRLQPAAKVLTPSDFPAAGLDQGDLDDLMAELALD